MTSLLNLGAGGELPFYPETIDQSLRFEDGDTANLNKSFSTGNKKTFTISFWFKRANISTYMNVFDVGSSGSSYHQTRFQNDDQLLIASENGGGVFYNFETTQVFRDTTNWYHFVMAFDTTQSTESDRFKLYVNGSQVTAFDTETYPSLNADTLINTNATHYIGRLAYASQFYLDGYLAEFNFIDGSQLDPTSFGETKNGVWIPKAISGLTYGTNGFRLTFADSSNLGDDTSGNGNDFTASGLASTDVVLDSPTNNFATWTPLFRGGEKSSSMSGSATTLSEGNLKASVPTNSYMGNTFRPTSGKWYCEFRINSIGSTNGEMTWGWIQATEYSGTTGNGGQTAKWSAYYHAYSTDHIRLYDESSQLGSNINLTLSVGDILQLAWDIDNNKGWVGINNTWYRTNASDGNPSAGTNETFTFTDDEAQNLQCIVANGTSTDVYVANFGQDDTFAGAISSSGNTDSSGAKFKYAPPTDFLALCSSNLPDTTLSPNQSEQADDYFITTTYSGDSDNSTQISTGFKPDFVWIKNRTEGSSDGAGEHMLYDSTRGVHDDLNSNNSSAEDTNTNGLQEFGSTFFRPGSLTRTNETGDNYTAWSWKANGGTTSSNTDGTITSTVQASTEAGFSIVTYTGTGSAGTIGHGLGSKPSHIIVKSRSHGSTSWVNYHGTLGAGKYLALQSTQAQNSGTNTDRWNNTEPTDSVFSVGTHVAVNNSSSYTYVAYVFAEIEGYSKFGSYTGNGSTDGTFVYTGFRPAWVMVKRTDSSNNWVINDATRTPNNEITGSSSTLYADTSGPESYYSTNVDFLSNGFKSRTTGGHRNASGTYIYIAFAEQPFKFSNAR